MAMLVSSLPDIEAKEVEDAANILLMVGGPVLQKKAEAEVRTTVTVSRSAPVTPSKPRPAPIETSPHPNHDLLDTLAALAAQKSPIHRKKIAWTDDMQFHTGSESFPMRRARSNSEPWGADPWATSLTLANAGGKLDSNGNSANGVLLPYMLEKYADTYNKGGRIGIYTREERDAIIKRFHEKRKRRIWSKQIRYHCRKNLADRRVRVKGRFVKMAAGAGAEGGGEDHDEVTPPQKTRKTVSTVTPVVDPSEPQTDVSSEGSFTSGVAPKRPRAPPLPASRISSRISTRRQSPEDVPSDEATGLPSGITDDEEMPAKRMRRHSIAY